MGLNSAFRITCNTLDDLEVALLSLLSSRMGSNNMQSRVFQALTISSSASTTPLSAQDLIGRISHLVGGTVNQPDVGRPMEMLPGGNTSSMSSLSSATSAAATSEATEGGGNTDCAGADKVEEAISAYSKGWFKTTSDICISVLNTNPSNSEARRLLVLANMKLKSKIMFAYSMYQIVFILLYSQQPYAVFFFFIDYELVISATKGNTTNIKLVICRGQANMRLGNLDDAISDFEHALTLSPTSAESATINEKIAKWKCTKAMREERYDEAIRHATDVISINPTSKCYYLRGLAYEELNRYKDAHEDYKLAHTLNPPEDLKSVLNEKLYECMMILCGHYSESHSTHQSVLTMLPDTASPLLDWSDNNLLDVAASELNTFPPLQAVAEDENRNICTPSTLSNSLNVPEVMLYVHFPPNYGELHIKGILNTGGRNCLPNGNVSVNTMYNTWSTSYSYFFHIPPKQAIPMTIQQLVWCDFLALDGDKDWATDSEKRKDYKRVRGLVDHLSVPFIHDVTELVSNVKYGLVLGDDPWEMFNTHKEDLIPEGRVIDVPQTRSVSHPCVFAPKCAYGCTLRQGREFLESIVGC